MLTVFSLPVAKAFAAVLKRYVVLFSAAPHRVHAMERSHLSILQHLHALGGKSGPRAAAKAKAEFAKAVISRIELLGA